MKDFDGWNQQKKRIDASKENKYFQVRDVFWSRVGQNVGFEQPRAVILSQLRLFDDRRLEQKMGKISKQDFENIEKAIRLILDRF